MKSIFYDTESGNWEQLPGGGRRKIIHMERLTVMIIRLPAGTVTDSQHSHSQEQAAIVLEGRVRMHVGSEARELGFGGGYVVPPNVKHHVEALEDCVLIDYFSPKRDDLTET